LQSGHFAASIDTMIDIQHDSPVPIHEQITGQIMAQVAAGDIRPGARLADYRAFAQELLANPQVVARAYADLEWEGVAKKHPSGGMEIVPGADAICRLRLQQKARERIRQAIRQGFECCLSEPEIRQAVDQALAAPTLPPVGSEELLTSIKKPSHASSHRDSQGIQDLSR
jgi:GntR family transcriptional regulator